ncbi:DinB family protein [Virgisporangium aurantiacum]|uniref:DinB-like domain-containing protein n=1 Tax=Virgisporangium aurantiacum TaxID=175570 RepID=A0A8J3Z9V5_9ACTN|nr:DinB family protein [Virgisporangium aurantiacum]GIJ57930.1 hypothetical protein Vau01_054460 [Virgisporangium aurantiacum]
MTDLDIIKQDLLKTAGFAYQRLHGRLRGLTDEEYRWEPAPGCWSIRPGDDGRWTADGSPLPVKPAPLTTIAWRIDHVIFVLEGERNATWLGATPVGTLGRDGAAPSAEKALRDLERAYDLFTRNVEAADPAGLLTPMGPIAGPYAEETRFAFVLHELDELIHHGSEIAAMRDLYRALAATDPILAAAERGDRAAVEERLGEDPSLRSTPLVSDMAARERWDAVRMLVDLGFDVTASGGITALHYAAAHGEQEIVELLLKHGADPSTRDTEFEQDAAGWAAFRKHDEVATYLRGVSSGA